MIGVSVPRIDAKDKVTGRAKYVEDMFPAGCLVAKVVHSTVANGVVKSINSDKALALPGVEAVVTCFDVPTHKFTTAGHIWSNDPSHQDVCDRLLLDKRVRFYGDDIAVVIAKDELTATKAMSLIQVTYEEYRPLLTPAQAMEPSAKLLHEEHAQNVLASTTFEVGEQRAHEETHSTYSGEFSTPPVQHVHIENAACFAYMEQDRYIVVSSTQIPHIVRRCVGQALGVPWGLVKLIKPTLGGGFGNKQDALYEPLCAFLTKVVGGRPVSIVTTREETFVSTRVRHAMDMTLSSTVDEEDRFVHRDVKILSNQGAYASHGHSVTLNAASTFRQLYSGEGSVQVEAISVYTNTPTAGAMRGYGVPQALFAIESHVDDIAHDRGIDPMIFRVKNCVRAGYVDPMNGIPARSYGLDKCMLKGREIMQWDKKRRAYKKQTGSVRKGIGMAIFSYKTGVYPIALERASARLALQQDGSVIITMGATEIGQGADTVFCQMASHTLGISMDKLHILSTQDTDTAPFDTAAYASRQSYVSGKALKKAATQLRGEILNVAARIKNLNAAMLTIQNNLIVTADTHESVMSVNDVAMYAYYDVEDCRSMTVEVMEHSTDNALSFGAVFAEVTVDIPLCKVKIDKLLNVHDSGVILNPTLAKGQVFGGMSMGIGYALSEQLLYDESTGRTLNNNMLDYKIGTAPDTPKLQAEFIEVSEPSGPYGNKALGEPPTVAVAPAIRNAILNATDVKFNALPITPQSMFNEFKRAGLL